MEQERTHLHIRVQQQLLFVEDQGREGDLTLLHSLNMYTYPHTHTQELLCEDQTICKAPARMKRAAKRLRRVLVRVGG
jgi:hypothetical protein